MNPSTPFIYRPIATSLLALGLAIAGIVAFRFLPVAPLPQIDFPTISIQASLPGASPEIMATSVATPLERQMGRVAGITEMTSVSSLGQTRIVIQLDLDRNIDGAARDIQAAINASLSQLPPDLPSLPTYRKVNPADAPIMIIALTSDIYNRGQMYDAASTILQQKLAQIEGVGQVIVGGSSLPAIRVELNPLALNAYGIGLESVRTAISAANANRPKGYIQIDKTDREIMSNDQLFEPEDYKSILIKYQNNTAVRVQDVGNVIKSVEDVRNAGLSDEKKAVVLIVFKQPGANVIETADRISAALPLLGASIQKGIELTVVNDRTTTIRASLRDVEYTLLIAIMLVISVVYVFLANARAALIPSVAVPLSLLGTFACMYLFKFSLDNLSLMALTIATGFVVDDAVVVLENISRHIEAGMKPFAAALKGTNEVGFTVLSMSTSLIAVFIPILLMGGIVGRLFREFAITLSIAILMSLVVSLTVTPMMAAFILKPKQKHEKTQNRAIKIKQYRGLYKTSLAWALRHERFMLLLTLCTILLTLILFKVIPKGFFAQQDTGRISSQIQADQNISFQNVEKKLTEFIHIIHKDPAVLHVVGFAGGNASASGNVGSVYITLKPLSERKMDIDAVIARLRESTRQITGAILYMQAAQDLVIGGRTTSAQFQYTLAAENLIDLNQWAPIVLEKMRQIPGIVDVNSNQRSNGLQTYVTYDRETASRLGLTTRAIDNTLYNAFGQRQISTMNTALNQYHVVMEVAPKFLQTPEILKDMYVANESGRLIQLSTFAQFAPSNTLLVVNHQNQFPSATISFNLVPGLSLGDALQKINDSVAKVQIPASIHGTFSGTAQAFQASLANQPYLIIAALLTVYIVLGILYESLIHPITILSTLPSAGVGALLALLMTGIDLSIIALIGIILLIGIVKKNAIMMIDFALQLEREHNMSPVAAIYKAAILRFRPIMMTTAAAMLGALPLALGSGVGSELRKPLGIAIIGGLLVSQMLTLYTTPVIYLAIENLRLRFVKRKKFRIIPPTITGEVPL